MEPSSTKSAGMDDPAHTGRGVLILGIGNPLREDDGLGWAAAECLARECAGPDVSVHQIHQLTPEWAEAVSRVGLVVFLDASRVGVLGELAVQWIAETPDAPSSFSHQLTPRTLLSCARALYGRAPRACLISLTGEAFGYGEGLSPTVQSRLPGMVQRVREIVEVFQTGDIPEL
jgi:hydrogenase maturation protease